MYPIFERTSWLNFFLLKSDPSTGPELRNWVSCFRERTIERGVIMSVCKLHPFWYLHDKIKIVLALVRQNLHFVLSHPIFYFSRVKTHQHGRRSLRPDQRAKVNRSRRTPRIKYPLSACGLRSGLAFPTHKRRPTLKRSWRPRARSNRSNQKRAVSLFSSKAYPRRTPMPRDDAFPSSLKSHLFSINRHNFVLFLYMCIEKKMLKS